MLHVVKPGETLFRISRRYGIEIEKLKKEREQIHTTLEQAKKLIDASAFMDARKELLIAQDTYEIAIKAKSGSRPS